MCDVNKQFELLDLVFNPIYVDLKYNEISLTFTDESVCLCGVLTQLCPHTWSACEVVLVPYVVGAVTMMHVLLFVLDVSMRTVGG